MTIRRCDRCKKTFTRKSTYDAHQNRKNKCIIIEDIEITDNEIITSISDSDNSQNYAKLCKTINLSENDVDCMDPLEKENPSDSIRIIPIDNSCDHIQNVDVKEYPIRCLGCNKTFSKNCNLLRHQANNVCINKSNQSEEQNVIKPNVNKFHTVLNKRIDHNSKKTSSNNAKKSIKHLTENLVDHLVEQQVVEQQVVEQQVVEQQVVEQQVVEPDSLDQVIFNKRIEPNDKEERRMIQQLQKEFEKFRRDAETVKKENEILRREIELLKTNGTGGNINMSNSNNNNTVNNIVLLGYGKEDMSKIDRDKLLNSVKQGFKSAVRLTDAIHFDPEHPENHNIYISNLKNKYAMMFNNHRWEVVTKTELIDKIYSDKKNYIEDNMDKYYNSLTTSQRNSLKRWLDTDDKHKKIMAIKDEIKLLLFNKKDIVLQSQTIAS